MTTKIARNAPCPCQSGKKYKSCCFAKDQAAETATATQQPAPVEVDESLEMMRAKTMAYNCMAQIQQWQARLTEVNARVAQLAALIGTKQ